MKDIAARGDMRRLTIDDVRQVLPALDELDPALSLLLARSIPDPDRTWSGSGEVDTAGVRLVPPDTLEQAAEQLAEAEGLHLLAVYRALGSALALLGSGDGVGAAYALLEAAALEEDRDRPERAEAYAKAAHRVSRDARNQQPAALALRRWARASSTLGRLDEASGRYEESHQASTAMSDARGAAVAAIGAGNVLEKQGRWADAEHWYHKALRALEGLDQPVPERWHGLLNVHIVMRARGALQECVVWLEQAEEAAEALGDASARPFLENARGQLSMWSGEPEQGERWFRSALRSAANARAKVIIELNLAEALLAQNRTLEAAETVREAERKTLATGLSEKLPEVYRLLGRIASADGHASAFVLFERALELASERELPLLEEAMTLQAYANAEELRNENDSATHLHQEATKRYQALGMAHARHPWADVFGPDPDSKTATSLEPRVEDDT